MAGKIDCKWHESGITSRLRGDYDSLTVLEQTPFSGVTVVRYLINAAGKTFELYDHDIDSLTITEYGLEEQII